jgi:hypothetical protein
VPIEPPATVMSPKIALARPAAIPYWRCKYAGAQYPKPPIAKV